LFWLNHFCAQLKTTTLSSHGRVQIPLINNVVLATHRGGEKANLLKQNYLPNISNPVFDEESKLGISENPVKKNNEKLWFFLFSLFLVEV